MPDGGLGGTGGGGVGTGGGSGEGGNAPESPGAAGPLVTEELQWRRRAIAAEERLADLEKQLSDARASMGRFELRSRLEREAEAMGAIDVEAVVLLALEATPELDASEAGAAVRDLKRRKPALFSAGAQASAMAADPGPGAGDDASLARALEEARVSGDRGALLRYLRMRRGV